MHIFTKKKLGIAVGLLLLAGTTAKAQVTVTATAATMGPTVYTTLNGAFTAINAGTHQGAITIDITANTTETGPCVLNSTGAGAAVYTSVLIRPTVDGVSISGATATGRGLIELKGADNVTIDGDNPNTAGTNRNLSIINTAVNTTTFTSCVRIALVATVVTSADNVTVKNCVITGSATGRNLAAATSTTGSENTTFGIYVGGNGGTTATDAPTAISNVTTQTAPSGTTANTFLVDNNAITSCARGIVFNGAATTVSSGVTVTNNVLGTAGVLAGSPPFTTPTSTIYTKGIWLAGTNALTVTGNTIQNQLSYVATPMSGIELNSNIGSGTLNVSNNTINGLCQNSTAAQNIKAILFSNAGGAYTISNNTITNVQAIQSGISSTTTTVGIEVNTAAPSGTITLNRISKIYSHNPGTTGAFGINVLGSSSTLTISNNFLYDIINDMTGGFSFDPLYATVGIRLAVGNNHKVYYNTVSLSGVFFGTVNTDLLSACLTVTGTGQTGLDIRNNIFSNTMTGGSANTMHTSIFLPSGGSSAMNMTLNNNVYYSGSTVGLQEIGQVGTTYASGNYYASNFNATVTTPATNLRSYTSTLSAAGTNDNASFASTAAAPFVSATDLHINNLAGNATDIDARATPIAGITTDIDGNTRNVTTPDAGADEFSLPGCVGSNGGTITPTTYSRCNGQTVTLTSTGATTGLGITYQWKISGTSGGPYVNVTGGSGATTVSYTTAALTPGVYYYVLAVTCSTGPSTGLSNEVTVTVNGLPTVAVSPTSALYCNPGPGIALTATGASTYTWAPATGLSAATGSAVTATPAVTTTFTVTGTDGNGCVNTATTVITSGPAVMNTAATTSSATICFGSSVNLSSAADPYSATILSENFNSGAPTWTRINNSTGGTPANAAWTDRPDGFVYAAGTPYHSNDNSQFVQTNSDAQGSGSTTNVLLVSPVFSTTNYTNLSVNFYHYYRDIADPGDSAVVEASLNGTNWTIAGAYTVNTGSENAFAAANVTLPAAFNNQATVYIRFRYIGTWDWYWSIDNVSVTGLTTNGYTYSWTSSPAGFTSSTQNNTGVMPTATTTYSIQITNPSGCMGSTTTSVTVNPLPTVTANSTATTVCAGTSVTLTGSGATSYSWDNGVTDGVAFTPATTTMYMVTGTDGNGCQDMDMITVTVNPLPSVTANATATAVCAGTSVTLTGSGTATSYSWDNGVTDGVSFTPASTMDYVVTGTDANSCTNMDTVTVTVNANPTVVANATATEVCAGTMVTLTGSGTSASYSWDNGVTDGMAFTPSSTMDYVVTGTDSNSCTGMDTITVTVNPLPTVMANSTATTVCSGTSVTLTGSGTATSYSWDNGVTDGVAFMPSSTMDYVVTGSDSLCSAMDTITVTVNTTPTVTVSLPSDTACYLLGQITLSGESPTGGTWSGNGVTGNTFDPGVAGMGTTMVYYMYTDSMNGCSATDSAAIVVDICNSITTGASSTSVEVYPNPNNGRFTVKLTPAGKVTVEIMNSLGQLIDSFTMNSDTKQVDLGSMPVGVYVVRVNNGGVISNHRLVIQ